MRKYVANRIRAGIQSRSDFQVSKYPRLLCRDTEKGSENPGIFVSSLETWKHSWETLLMERADKNWTEFIQSEKAMGAIHQLIHQNIELKLKSLKWVQDTSHV